MDCGCGGSGASLGSTGMTSAANPTTEKAYTWDGPPVETPKAPAPKKPAK